jgi:DnaJ-class molecular chaperone
MGLADCPRCEGHKVDPFKTGEPCTYCEGAGKVTLMRHHEYLGLAPASHDHPPPSQEK